jgi:hypothetical protein
MMANWDARFYGDGAAPKTRAEVLAAMVPYIAAQLAQYGGHGLKLNSITRHMLGLTAGLPGARAFRQMLSDPKKLATADPACCSKRQPRSAPVTPSPYRRWPSQRPASPSCLLPALQALRTCNPTSCSSVIVEAFMSIALYH